MSAVSAAILSHHCVDNESRIFPELVWIYHCRRNIRTIAFLNGSPQTHSAWAPLPLPESDPVPSLSLIHISMLLIKLNDITNGFAGSKFWIHYLLLSGVSPFFHPHYITILIFLQYLIRWFKKFFTVRYELLKKEMPPPILYISESRLSTGSWTTGKYRY